jgi:hypothetical protein
MPLDAAHARHWLHRAPQLRRVSEDASGDLIYHAYNFGDFANARRIDVSENGRTTNFSVEVRDGAEQQTPTALTYTFETQGFRYVITLNRDGTGTLDAFQNGTLLQSEDLIGYQQGTAQPRPHNKPRTRDRMTMTFATYEKSGRVATITLNRPESRNAIATQQDCDDLAGALWQANDDADINAVILTGAGKIILRRRRSESDPRTHAASARARRRTARARIIAAACIR